jgi:hypothetical protein
VKYSDSINGSKEFEYLFSNEMIRGHADPSESNEIKKVYRDEYPTQWEYRSIRDRNSVQEIFVATCSTMGDGNRLCQSFTNYSDLVYNKGLRDRDIERLPELEDKINSLAPLWEEEKS